FVKSVREPDDRNGHVRFDERGEETERWTIRRERPRKTPLAFGAAGPARHRAFPRLHHKTALYLSEGTPTHTASYELVARPLRGPIAAYLNRERARRTRLSRVSKIFSPSAVRGVHALEGRLGDRERHAPGTLTDWNSCRGDQPSSKSVSLELQGLTTSARLSLSPSCRRRSFPHVKGPRERIQLLEPEQERHLSSVEIRDREQSAGGPPAHIVKQGLIRRSGVAQAPLQRARAGA